MRKDPRQMGPGPITGLNSELKGKLELLSHQVSFFANKVHKHLRNGNIAPTQHKGKEKTSTPAQDLETLIRLVSELQDVHEDILYNSDLNS